MVLGIAELRVNYQSCCAPWTDPKLSCVPVRTHCPWVAPFFVTIFLHTKHCCTFHFYIWHTLLHTKKWHLHLDVVFCTRKTSLTFPPNPDRDRKRQGIPYCTFSWPLPLSKSTAFKVIMDAAYVYSSAKWRPFPLFLISRTFFFL